MWRPLFGPRVVRNRQCGGCAGMRRGRAGTRGVVSHHWSPLQLLNQQHCHHSRAAGQAVARLRLRESFCRLDCSYLRSTSSSRFYTHGSNELAKIDIICHSVWPCGSYVLEKNVSGLPTASTVSTMHCIVSPQPKETGEYACTQKMHAFSKQLPLQSCIIPLGCNGNNWAAFWCTKAPRSGSWYHIW